MDSYRTKEPTKNFDLQRVGISVDKSPVKRDLAPEDGDSQFPTKEKVDEEAKKSARTFLNKMDAIAYGVEARYELITDHSRRVTEETIAIARQFGIPEAEIKRWAASRLKCDIKEMSVIRYLIAKTEGSFLAGLAKERIQGKR